MLVCFDLILILFVLHSNHSFPFLLTSQSLSPTSPPSSSLFFCFRYSLFDFGFLQFDSAVSTCEPTQTVFFHVDLAITMCMCVFMCHSMYVEVRRTFGSQFSLPIIHALGTKPRRSVSTAVGPVGLCCGSRVSATPGGWSHSSGGRSMGIQLCSLHNTQGRCQAVRSCMTPLWVGENAV